MAENPNLITDNQLVLTRLPLPLASFSRRFLAFVIDCAIVAIPSAFLGSAIPFLGAAMAWFFYFPVLESSSLQATLGKRVVGIKVSNAQGSRLSLRVAVIRNFIKIASGLFCGFGFLIALFTKHKQSLHDLLADTFVFCGNEAIPSDVMDAWVDSSKAAVFELKQGFKSQTNGHASNASDFGVASGAQIKNADVVSALEKLTQLHRQGALTHEEFIAAKSKILA